MSFSISGTNLPGVSSYAGAVYAFERAKPYSGRYSNERNLLARNDRDYMGVRMSSTGDVIFRYHRTDVVTWHPNNTFTIDPWASLSTSIFIKELTPHGVYAQMTHGMGPVMCSYRQNSSPDYERYGHHIYLLRRNKASFKFDKQIDIWVTDEAEKIPYPHVASRRAARIALKKFKFKEFCAWLPAAMDINAPKVVTAVSKPSRIVEMARQLNATRYGYRAIIEAISDRSLWLAFLRAPDLKPTHEPYKSYWGRSWGYTRKRHFDMIMKAVRTAIYVTEGVIERGEISYAISWSQLKAVRAAQELYGVGRVNSYG